MRGKQHAICTRTAGIKDKGLSSSDQQLLAATFDMIPPKAPIRATEREQRPAVHHVPAGVLQRVLQPTASSSDKNKSISRLGAVGGGCAASNGG